MRLLLTSDGRVMGEFASALRTRVAGWVSAGIILVLNAILVVEIALGA